MIITDAHRPHLPLPLPTAPLRRHDGLRGTPVRGRRPCGQPCPRGGDEHLRIGRHGEYGRGGHE